MEQQRIKRDFVKTAEAIGRLVEKKNNAYGDSFAKTGDVMRIFYPNGISPDQYDDALGIVRGIGWAMVPECMGSSSVLAVFQADSLEHVVDDSFHMPHARKNPAMLSPVSWPEPR
jgi:hypothetical protein